MKLHGPTLFEGILGEACSRAMMAQSDPMNQEYTVLLILTDGIINDMGATIDSLVTASRLPLSVIIVGVGDAAFDQMEALDSDEGLLRDSRGNMASRDIVQFVPYRQMTDGARLAKAVLAEVPGQVVDYYKSIGIEPNPAVREEDRSVNPSYYTFYAPCIHLHYHIYTCVHVHPSYVCIHHIFT